MSRVLVIADSPSVRRGLAALVREAPELMLAGSAGWRDPWRFDFDIVLGELRALDLPSDLPEPFVILSDSIPISPAPGRGFLRPEAGDAQILAALLAVSTGLAVLDVTGPQAQAEAAELLSNRELEVLELLAEGMGNREIGQCLHISPNTVKFHLAALYSKLGVNSRTEAVTAGIRGGHLLL